MQIQATAPAPTFLEHPQPDIARRGHYLAKYYKTALPALFRPHRLEPYKTFKTYRSQFSLSPKEQQGWFDLFEVSPDLGRRIPFTYITTSATLSFMYLLADLGINFKFLRHLASEIIFEARNLAVKAGHNYRYQMVLEDIFLMRGSRVVVEVAASIVDEAGQLCAKHKERFVVSHLPKGQLAKLTNHARFNRGAKEHCIKTYKRRLEHADSVLFNIPANMGTAYGRVSGDMNMVHTTPLAARWLGYPKPFIQGFCTANLILKQLALYRGLHPASLTTTFVRPVFVDQQVRLHHAAQSFELTNLAGKVLAYGAFKGKETIKALS